MSQRKRLIALDFDGVIHSYTSPWTAPNVVSDAPTPGAQDFLVGLVGDGRFEVVVHSSRCSDELGALAIKGWLAMHLGDVYGSWGVRVAECIRVVDSKPPAHVTLNDRAITFEGTWPDLDTLAAFRPWSKRAFTFADPATQEAARKLTATLDALSQSKAPEPSQKPPIHSVPMPDPVGWNPPSKDALHAETMALTSYSDTVNVTEGSYPAIYEALEILNYASIELAVNDGAFVVDAVWARMLPEIDAAIAGLSVSDLKTFVTGNPPEVEVIADQSRGLGRANAFLSDVFVHGRAGMIGEEA